MSVIRVERAPKEAAMVFNSTLQDSQGLILLSFLGHLPAMACAPAVHYFPPARHIVT
jgi:hypothetical protein